MNRKLRNFDSGTKVDIPVFVFPEELTFTDRELRRILTIYNPYDYRVQFRGSYVCGLAVQFATMVSQLNLRVVQQSY
jgi:hypothetical protein